MASVEDPPTEAPAPDLLSDQPPRDGGKASGGAPRKRPIVVVVVGMAGSGKSAVTERLVQDAYNAELNYYTINLDPAVLRNGFEPNIDIQETVDYKKVMKQHQLGPNGAILTSLNLFATRFDQVMKHLEDPENDDLDYIFVDTPGQIEVFTWSASGQIILDAFASAFPTCILYVCDTPRCCQSQTFIANMTYACSMLYKSQLPFILLFNKVDVQDATQVMGWVRDCESFFEVLEQEDRYSSALSRSLSLMLEEFYNSLQCVDISAITGDGCEKLFPAFERAAEEYETEYLECIRARQTEVEERERARKEKQEADLKRRLEEDGGLDVVGGPEGEDEGEASEDDSDSD